MLTSTTFLTIRGNIPVGPNTAVQLSALHDLQQAIEGDDDNAYIIDSGVLYIDINTTVHSAYPANAIKAIDAFCTAHATEGAVFDHNQGDNHDDLLFFGFTPAMKRKAHLHYLQDKLEAYEALFDQAVGRSDDAYNSPYNPK